MNFAWERLSDGVYRCRLPFLDVTIGLVQADAVRFGADPEEVARAIEALRAPEHPVLRADVDLGGTSTGTPIRSPGPRP